MSGRYPERPGSKGRPGGPSEQGAQYYAPQVKGRRAQVLNGFDGRPSTSEQIAERIGIHWYLVRPRLSELQALGFVVDTGATAPSALGGRSTIWRQSTPEEYAQHLARQAAADEKEHAHG
jgi:hypothetical protein